MTTFSAIVFAMCLGLCLHTFVNLRALRTPTTSNTHGIDEVVALLIPARNESSCIAASVSAACAQQGLARLHVAVLDDASVDDTAAQARDAAAGDPRVEVVTTDTQPPDGWLGKPWACHRLSELPQARAADVLVFVDADVILEPRAVAAAVNLLRDAQLDVVCPYPRQVSSTMLQHLVQPLLQWSWASTLPLRLAEKSGRASLTAANGQFMVVDANAYRRAHGHRSVAADVIEDIGLVRALKRSGGRGGVVDGTRIATCEMYRDNSALVAGYTKSLWAAFGTRVTAAMVSAIFAALFILPLPAGLMTLFSGAWVQSGLWFGGYATAALSRWAVAHRTAGPRWSCFAHPISIALFVWLLARSWRAKAQGTLMWKGRALA